MIKPQHLAYHRIIRVIKNYGFEKLEVEELLSKLWQVVDQKTQVDYYSPAMMDARDASAPPI